MKGPSYERLGHHNSTPEPLDMTAKNKRSTPALSVVRDTNENDVTAGVNTFLQPYINRKIAFRAFERCSHFVLLKSVSRVIVR